MSFGAKPSDWDHLTLVLGLGNDLLPVVSNPSAPISPNSALKRLGQIPSLYNHETKVTGFAKWTIHRTTDQEIERWKQVEDYGICIQTRAIRAFDCDIVDEDLAAKVFDFFNQSPLPVFPVRGRSNASKFLLPFRLEGPHSKRILHLDDKNKIEFLADGQQFIAVGTHPSGVRYEWRDGLPSEIPTLTEPQFEHIWSELKTIFNAGETKDAISERKPPGGEIDDAKLAFLEKAGVITGWSPEGAAYIDCPFKSGHSKEGDITETIYFPAGLRGYEAGHFNCFHASCAGRHDDDFFEALGYTVSMFDALPAEMAAAKLKYNFVQAAEYSLQPSPGYIIEDIVPQAELVVLFGESGSGKSFVALDQAFSVARGIDWNGKKVKQGRVAYIAAEGSGGIRKRLKAYARHHGISDKDFSKIPLTILAAAPSLLDSADTKALIEGILAQGEPLLIFVDTFAQTTPGANENSGEDVGKAIQHCRFISQMTGACVILIHHAGKDLTKGARGWSGLRAAADAEIEISRIDRIRNIKISKQKDGEDGAEWGLTLLEVPIGENESGSIISSCVCGYTTKQRSRQEKRKFGPLQKLALDTLEKLGGGYIAKTILSRAMVDALPGGEGRDTRAQRVHKAIESLVLSSDLELNNGLVGMPLAVKED